MPFSRAAARGCWGAGCSASPVRLGANTTAGGNTAVGAEALANTTSFGNVALGAFALNANTTAADNVAVGRDALGANTTGSFNIAIGRAAGINGVTVAGGTAVLIKADGQLGSCGTRVTILRFPSVSSFAPEERDLNRETHL